MQLRDSLQGLYQDDDFVELYPRVGQLAESPWRLALVSVMQYRENLSDRQAADAVRGRIDWKYALCLELEDDGFDYSVLSEFRKRLVEGGIEPLILDKLLEWVKKQGLIRERGKQRTDATHVLAAVDNLNRLEMVGRTLQIALEAVAEAEGEWLKQQIPPEWYERYGKRVEEYRLPKGEKARQEWVEQVGQDGRYLLERITADERMHHLLAEKSVLILQRMWEEQYHWDGKVLKMRRMEDLPPSSERLASPHDEDARFSGKRDMTWVGYKVHLTESCDEDRPNLITQVETTLATQSDILALADIQADLAGKHLLPDQQIVDMGYTSGETIADSQSQYQIDLLGPVHGDTSWQGRSPDGLSITQFTVDWDAQQVRCPTGQASYSWKEKPDHGTPAIFVRFRPSDCQACPLRPQCTRSKSGARELTLIPRPDFEALQMARQRQQTAAFRQAYALRSGIEGTISQAVRGHDLRHARYRGFAKVHLEHLLTAVALNLSRLFAWFSDVPRSRTRISHFLSLAA